MTHAIAKICAAINADDAAVHLYADEMREVIDALDDRERAIGRERTRADAAEAECARLRAIVEAADELIALDYAAEVESYSETAPGSHAAAQVRAADAYSALVRLRDAWRETQGAAATPPAVAAEAATGAALAGEGRTTERAECRCGHPVEMHRGADRCGAYGCGCDLSAEEAGWS